MNPFSRLAKAYIRWRHSKGYGVHSPYAYEMVRTVVAPGNYAYYAYRDIEAELLLSDSAGSARLRDDARMILRLMNHLGSRCLVASRGSHEVFPAVARSLGKAYMELHDDFSVDIPQDNLVMADGDAFPPAFVENLMKTGVPVVAIRPSDSIREAICGTMANGLILEGTRIILAVPRSDMVLTRYTMRF